MKNKTMMIALLLSSMVFASQTPTAQFSSAVQNGDIDTVRRLLPEMRLDITKLNSYLRATKNNPGLQTIFQEEVKRLQIKNKPRPMEKSYKSALHQALEEAVQRGDVARVKEIVPQIHLSDAELRRFENSTTGELHAVFVQENVKRFGQ